MDLPLESDLVVLWGSNGAGKTNLLEAAAVLATWKSFRGSSWDQVVRWGQAAGSVEGHAESQLGRAWLGLSVAPVDGGRYQRRARMDGTTVREAGTYFARLRAVTFTPDDTRIVREGPDLRRRFMDRAAFNAWPIHLDRVRTFQRLLSQKSALLRSGRATVAELEAWDLGLVEAGVEVALGRERLIQALRRPLAQVHGLLSGGASVELSHRSALLGEEGADPSSASDRYLRALHRVRDEELRRGINLVGPQRDDLLLSVGQPGGGLVSARSFASQGQVRTLALALKLAELSVAGAEGDPPLLLMDDLSSELDGERLGRLVGHIEGLRSQVLVTTTDPEPVLRCSSEGGQAVEIRSGTVASVVSRG